MKLVALVTITALMAVTACKGGGAATAPTGDDLNKGYGAINPVRGAIQRALAKALVRGPVAALAVCSTDAGTIAAAAVQPGVVVGRVTRKPRNPANVASGWQGDALAQFELDAASGRNLAASRFARILPDGRLAYAEPLVIQPLCLACHGDAIEPDVQAALAERYPDDRATGYRVGELRGAIWADVPR